MPSGIRAACEGVVAAFTSAGLSASMQAGEVNLPGVWVWPDVMTPDRLDGNGTLMVRCNLIVPDVESLDALEMLDTLLAAVLDVVSPDGEIRPQIVRMPDPPASLPSFGLSVPVNYTREMEQP